MKIKIRSLLVEILTNTIGKMLVFFKPKKVKQLSENGVTLVFGDTLSLTERLMRRAILKKIKKKQDYNTLAELHQKYWRKQGEDFFSRTRNNLENIHLPTYKPILSKLENQISKESIKFDKLIEIGTGNGSVLHYLSTIILDVEQMIGIDLSQGQIGINKINYKENSRLKFIDSNVLDWIEELEKGNMIFFTFRGVLEYFTQQQLTDFLEKLNSLGNIMFFAIEPNGIKHDFNSMPNSEIYGSESSFSHNYDAIFKKSGFKIWHYEQKEELGQPHITSIIGAKNYN